MKTLIVNPPTCTGMKYIREGRCEQRLNSFQYVMVPISLPMIGGALEAKNHDVKILDCIANDVDVGPLTSVGERVLITRLEAVRRDIGNLSLLGVGQAEKTSRLRENGIDRILRDSVSP